MELSELVEKQKELNSVIGKYPETIDHLSMAIVGKCGKVSELLASEWRWWDVPAKCDRAELVSALTDVFKFLLVGCVVNAYKPKSQSQEWGKNWEDCKEKGDADQVKEAVFFGLCEILSLQDIGYINLHFFIKVCANLDISRDEIEASYLKLWEQNMQRFTAR
jgi:dimeric dUTPase (all-alpha-NTP-PPase superfamily)